MTKTPRGTYYYLCVADQFYEGEQPVKIPGPKKFRLERYNPNPAVKQPKEKKKARYKSNRFVPDSNYHGRKHKGTRHWKSHGGQTLVRIAGSDSNTYTMEVDDAVHTGEYTAKWTPEVSKAKKFRIHSKAVAKAEELAKLLSTEFTKIQILLHEGN
ncbi:MAG TPA: hypothetical protein VEC99_18380 [Clostridia bacterium]|nr:hypothetical protein [Clostridia bacterium]